MTRPQVVTFISSWLLSACGPSVIPLAEVDRVCGQESPVELLELDSGTNARLQLLDRESGVERLVVTAMPGDFRDEAVRAQSVVWSVGPCGEDPIEIAQGLHRLTRLQEQPEHLFGCGEADDVYVLDPSGEREPSLVAAGVGCTVRWTPHGIVSNSIEEDLGPVLLHPWPDDPWQGPAEPVVLMERARLDHETTGWRPVVGDPQVVEDELFAVTEAHVLVRIDLVEGTSAEVAVDVHSFDASPEFVVWQSRSDEMIDGEGPVGDIWVLDRNTQQVTKLMNGMLDAVSAPTWWSSEGIVNLRTSTDGGEDRMYFMPSADYAVVPEGRELALPIDHRWLIMEPLNGPYSLWDPTTNEQTPFLDAQGYLSLEDSGTWLAHMVSAYVAQPEEGELLRIEPDREPITLAPRAGRQWRVLEDDRVVTHVDVDRNGFGNLIVVDPKDHRESLIDEGVSSVQTYPDEWPFDVFYAKDDGERVQLLRTRLSAEVD